MSSPSRVLSPKRDSIFNSRSSSPLKSRPSTPAKAQAQSLRKLPKLDVDLTPAKKQVAMGFQIYEDKPEEYELYHKSRDTDSSYAAHDDKENILQPKVMELHQRAIASPRIPLGNLDISKFTGALIAPGQILRLPVQLTQLYQPKSYDNESRTAHKFNGLPSFVTPPRDAMKKILHRSQIGQESAEDEMELRLIAKLNELARHKRSMSVGVNKGRRHLVQKSRFQIHTA